MRYQPSQLSWIAIALVLLVAGLILGNLVLLAGAVFVLVSALLSTAIPPPSGIAVTRSLAKVACWVGDTLTVERRLTARHGTGAIFVHDDLPPEARVVSGSNLRVVWKWPGSKAADISYRVQFSKRGQYALQETEWESRAPFGVDQGVSASSGPPFQVSVVPRIRSITRLNAVRGVARHGRYLGDLSRTGAATDEFRELRPYQPGDPFKRINWKASARGIRADNLPLVNDVEPETKKGVWIFLDMADYMDVGVPLSNPLENTVEASGTLAQYYLAQGSTLGAYAYNSYDGRGELLTPEAGKRQFNRLIQMLAGLKPGPPEEDLLLAVERCKSFLLRLEPAVYVITRLDVHYDRPGEAPGSFDRFKTAITRLASLGTLSGWNNPVRVVHVDPQGSPEAAQGLGLTRWETRLVAKDLRDAGASVIEWEPSREEFTSVLVRHVEAYR
ncbi:MAG: DUF58 domain-containing protein [Chloroflexi bacterium]|nr:DUF58 domain-containing protein [Chloroflexota bacterium]MYK33845.1 DUF58 domain-containing protein [Chloroflexota bacterium]